MVDRSSSKTASPAPFLVNGQCTSGSGRQGGEFRDQNRSSIRSFFRADFRRSGLRLGEGNSAHSGGYDISASISFHLDIDECPFPFLDVLRPSEAPKSKLLLRLLP